MSLGTTINRFHYTYSLFGKAVVTLLILILLSLIISNPLVPSVSAFSTSRLLLHHGYRRFCCGFKSRSASSLLLASSASSSESTSDTNSSTIYKRARMTFDEFDRKRKGGLNSDELNEVLSSLDMDATPEEQRALFSHLDSGGDGFIDFQEFVDWYTTAVEAAQQTSQNFRKLLMSRRTVNAFNKSPVSEDVLRRAIECAIAAPNRSRSEPWRFIKVGSETVKKLQDLNRRVVMAGGEKVTSKQQTPPLLPAVWTDIPGWCVVTSKVTPSDPETELKDFRSTSCAMQNFMLSMWSEGVGSKWTEGPTQKTQQFADLVGIDTTIEKVVGIIWYGFVAGGLSSVDPKQERKRDVDDVLSILL